MLDPLTALSVAGTIVQFVDFSCGILSKAYEIYEGSTGTTAVNEHLEKLADHFSEQLIKLSRPLGTDGVSGCLTYDEARFEVLCADCRSVAKQLIKRLGKLKVKGKHKAWESLAKAFESAWSKEDIVRLVKRLEGFKETLKFQILVNLRDGMDLVSLQQSERFEKLEPKIQHIITALFDQKGSLREIEHRTLVITELLNHTEIVIRDEARETRALILDVLQKLDDQNVSTSVNDIETLQGNFYAAQQQEQNRMKKVESRILNRLWFATKEDRCDTVVNAHKSTFQWILDEHTPCSRPGSNFLEWLRGDGSTYWVSGKAGSGKSTLMKFIYGDSRTTIELRKWANGTPLFTPAFFLWNSGATDQRSHTGLLRSILHDALSQEPDLIPICFPWLWAQEYSLLNTHDDFEGEFQSPGNANSPFDKPLSFEKLAIAFDLLTTQTIVPLKMCIFIDGLDESDGDKAELFNLISASSKASNVKICASSRPDLIFEDYFEDSPKLRLQDLTADDIKAYVSSNLNENKRFQHLAKVEPLSTSLLIKDIVDIADGVFLWVRLATKSLLDGLSNHDQIFDLQKRLKQMPTELVGLYDHMLTKIDPFYQAKASEIFQIVRASQIRFDGDGENLETPLTVLGLSFCTDEDDDLAIRAPIDTMLPCDIESRQIATADLLKSRCAGLLETDFGKTGFQTTDMPIVGKVRYIHWTAREYLESPAVQQRLLGQTKGSKFNPHVALLKEVVMTYKTMPLHWDKTCWDSIRAAMWHASVADKENDARYIPLLDELNKAVTGHFVFHHHGSKAYNQATHTVHWTNYEPHRNGQSEFEQEADLAANFLTFTIRLGLSLYVKDKLGKVVGASQSNGDQPLLKYAIRRFNKDSHAKMSPKIVATLLQRGENPNIRYFGKTLSCWETLLTRAKSYENAPQADILNLISIFELFIQYGASVNARITHESGRRMTPLSIVTEYFMEWAPLESGALHQALISRGAVLGGTVTQKATDILLDTISIGAQTVITVINTGTSVITESPEAVYLWQKRHVPQRAFRRGWRRTKGLIFNLDDGEREDVSRPSLGLDDYVVVCKSNSDQLTSADVLAGGTAK